VCAIVGGVAAQEIIKIISANDAPLNNFFFYDSTEGSGVVERIPTSQ
jgi:ubiquitin-like 1-activating enzyme E1 A